MVGSVGPCPSPRPRHRRPTARTSVILTVTDVAVAKILELREAEDEPDGLALRVAVTGIRGPEYTYDLTFEPVAEADGRPTTCTSRASCR